MMSLASLVGWVVANLPLVLGVAYAAVNLAVAVTKMTPSSKDDTFVAKVKAILDRISILTHSNAAGTVKMVGTKSQPK